MRLIELIEHHDWNYIYSEDNYYFQRGSNNEKRIFAFMSEHNFPYSLLDIFNAVSGYYEDNMISCGNNLYNKKEWVEQRLNYMGIAGERILSNAKYNDIMNWINKDFVE